MDAREIQRSTWDFSAKEDGAGKERTLVNKNKADAGDAPKRPL